MNFKRMGVMNITPNSFSDGGEISVANFQEKIKSFGNVEAIDIGAESTAPMNESIPWETEWERIQPYLPMLKGFKGVISFDTYHPETMEEVLRYYVNNSWDQTIWWNDVSGKMDGFAKDFLELSPTFSYVLCHNLAPNRKLTGRHMDYVDPELTIEKVAEYLRPFSIPQVIFDPCLGFSKTYEQNWMILENFGVLQELAPHSRWLLGFSRKSFLRKKHHLGVEDRDKLDEVHLQELKVLKNNSHSELWIRTHRPELL